MEIAAVVHSTQIFGAGTTTASSLVTKWADGYKFNTDNVGESPILNLAQFVPFMTNKITLLNHFPSLLLAELITDITYTTLETANAYTQIASGLLDFLCYNLPFIVSNTNLLQIPVAGSALVPVYHISSLQHSTLILDGETLGLIFAGAITTWDDPAIQDLNPNVTLPHANITTIASPGQLIGTTDVFKRALSLFSPYFETELANAGNDFANMKPAQTGRGVLQPNTASRISSLKVKKKKKLCNRST